MADIFDVVADPTRREVLRVLLERYVSGHREPASSGEISVTELVQRLRLSQPTVSKHLKVLRDARLVTVREQGQHRFYRLDYAPLERIEDWLSPFLSADVNGTPDPRSASLGPRPRAIAASLGAAAARAAAVAAGRTAARAGRRRRAFRAVPTSPGTPTASAPDHVGN